MSQYLPITPSQIVDSAVEAADAGAAILHLHARDGEDGRPTGDPAYFRKICPVLAERTSAIINITTGGSSDMKIEQRLAYPLQAKPERCSLNMGSMNFSIHPVADRITNWRYDWKKPKVEGMKDCVFKNTFADIADETQVAALFEIQQERFSGLDVLVNCAGIAGPTAGVDKITEQEWKRTIEVNLNGQYRCLHHAVPMLRASKAANIICISSVAGRMGIPWRTPYVATKWAIVGSAKSLAIELGPDIIRVNAVQPGIVEGPRMDGVISARAKLEGVDEKAMREEYLKHISLHRMVTADDVALMCLFLCSPAAQNVTGQAISVDGNYS